MGKPTAKPDALVIICRCGEGVLHSKIAQHVCRPKEDRPPMLADRWDDWRVRREVIKAIVETGSDPAFAERQRDMYEDDGRYGS